MKLGRLNHVGVATPSLDKAIAFWRGAMDADPSLETLALCIIRTL